MIGFSKEFLELAKQAKSLQELIKLAKDNEYQMTAIQAKTIFCNLKNSGNKLSDDDLNMVAGGDFGNHVDGLPTVLAEYQCKYWQCKQCGKGCYIANNPTNLTYYLCPICKDVTTVRCDNCKSVKQNNCELLCDHIGNR